jgi:hypothetical protein
MINVEPHKNKNNKKEVDVWVVTHGGVKNGEDLEHGEGSGKKIDKMIRKVPKPAPKFGAT